MRGAAYFKIIAALLSQLLASHYAHANVRLPTLIGDHMVLQRDMSLRLWGWAGPGEKIRIAFHGTRLSARADKSGRWSVAAGPFPGGGPFDMTIEGHNRLMIHDILLGDVWLASGQSNMDFPLDPGNEWRGGVPNAAREIANANYPKMRLFIADKAVADTPQLDVESRGWHAVTPQSVGDFSAVAYFFGREIYQRYEVPIGLIKSVWGGTLAEAWMSQAALEAFPEFDSGISSLPGTIRSQTDYQRYLNRLTTWYREHGVQDRGMQDGRPVWADPKLDTSSWPTLTLPRPDDAWGKDWKGFGGVVWFRRRLIVPPEHAGKAMVLHLDYLAQDDVTYFNGEKVGETKGSGHQRAYWISGEAVRAGENTLVIRLSGEGAHDQSGVGIFDSHIRAEIDGVTLPLTGVWSAQPGPDLSDFPEPDAAAASARILPNIPTALFNGMIHPLVPFKIKGVIWYQGEANALENRSVQYRRLFPALIEDWRRQWGYPVPFLFVQLAGFGSDSDEPREYSWPELREAQAMALSLPRTGMATAVDVGEEGDIHPRNKQEVGHRLALAAEGVVYGENIVFSGPTFRSMQIEGSRIRVQFSALRSGLMIKDRYGYVRGFDLAGSDGKFHRAQAALDGNTIVVSSEAVKDPKAVRYDWMNTPDGNIYNREGLPAPPFRSQ
jgi:sialate O-acetylesterase